MFGEPMSIDRRASKEEAERKRLDLEKRLITMTEEADSYFE